MRYYKLGRAVGHDTIYCVCGRLDRVVVEETGKQVEAGDHLLSVYSPELLAAQEELIQSRDGGNDVRLNAARQKLRLLGLSEEQVSQIETDGEVYELNPTAMSTSHEFKAGHRIRVEVASSKFPQYMRNLNTGGNNYDETEGVVAHNTVHHSSAYPSQIILPVRQRED